MVIAGALFTTARGDELKVGDAFPDLQQFELQGKVPESLKGKVVLLDFWASWCGPCRQSFSVLNELQEQYAGRGLVVIGVSVDAASADMQRFLKRNHASFLTLHDAHQKLVRRVNVETMPSSVLIDAEGRVRYVHSGFHGEETRRQYLREIDELVGSRHARK